MFSRQEILLTRAALSVFADLLMSGLIEESWALRAASAFVVPRITSCIPGKPLLAPARVSVQKTNHA